MNQKLIILFGVVSLSLFVYFKYGNPYVDHGTILISIFILRIVSGVWCGLTANTLNRSYILCAILGFIFPGVTMIVVGFLKPKKLNI